MVTNAVKNYRPLELQPEELEILTPVKQVDMIRWAREKFILDEFTSEVAGPWSEEYTPFLVEPLERMSAPGPCTMSIRACTQAGKTTFGNICLGYWIDVDPGPSMIIMPTESTAKKRVNTRIRPMFKACPSLMRHLGSRLDELNIGKETILDNMILYLAWAGSPAALADSPVCKLIFDEVGKFPAAAGKEADPVSLGLKRTRTFRTRRKILDMTTPVLADDPSDRRFKQSSMCRWWARCPYCKKYHIPVWKNVEIDKKEDGSFYTPDEYGRGAKSRYVCPKCEKAWTELDRWKAISEGRYAPEGCQVSDNGRITGKNPATLHHGYHINALMLHPRFQTVDDLAAEWVKAQNELKAGDTKPLQDFINSQLGQSWKEVGKTLSSDKIRANKTEMAARMVPAWVKLLVGSLDYHRDEMNNVLIDYEVAGYGNNLRNCVILVGAAGSWRELEDRVLMSPFPWAEQTDQEELAVITVFADSGFEPDEVYGWCRKFPGIAWPVKGVDFQKTPLFASDLDKVLQRARRRVRRKSARMYRGMQLINIHTNYFKNVVTNWAETPKGNDGSTEFYADIPDYYFDELTNEHKVKEQRGRQTVFVWKPKTESLPTHSLDLRVYNAAAAYWNKANLMVDKDTEEQRIPAARRNVQTPRRRIGKVNRLS